jgi:hypothetical protein
VVDCVVVGVEPVGVIDCEVDCVVDWVAVLPVVVESVFKEQDVIDGNVKSSLTSD